MAEINVTVETGGSTIDVEVESGGTTYTVSISSTGPKGDKGDKGDTGDNSSVTETEIKYQSSSSGTTVPTGTWSADIPTVEYPNFLWTRTIITFNNDETCTFYSVAKAGKNGAGSAGINVPLMDGTGAIGTSERFAREDHVHPSDSTKQNTLTFDTTPTESSLNPVTSGGIYSYASDAVRKKHSHDNKLLLDSYTQTEVNLADAVGKKHNHSNKIELDSIVTGDKAKWDGYGTSKQDKKVSFTDTYVPTSAWASDATYADFPYKATIALEGVTASMIPETVLSPSESMSGNFAPICETYAGGIYLWAADVPESAITIPTILCWG